MAELISEPTGHGPIYHPGSRTPWTWNPADPLPNYDALRQAAKVAEAIQRTRDLLAGKKRMDPMTIKGK